MKTSHYLSLSVDEENAVIIQKLKFNIHVQNKYDRNDCLQLLWMDLPFDL